MTDYSLTFDYVTYSDLTRVICDYNTTQSDEVTFGDSSSAFYVFSVTAIPDTAVFGDMVEGCIDIHTTKVLDEVFSVHDSSFAIGIYRPNARDQVDFSDSVVSYLQTSGRSSDPIRIRTKTDAFVTYPTETESQADFYDSCMSILDIHSARDFKNAVGSLVGTSEETLYTVSSPAREATVINISLCNRITSDITADVILNIGGNDTYLLQDMPIPASQSFVINNSTESSIELKPGDYLKVCADTDGSLDVYVALMEKTIR